MAPLHGRNWAGKPERPPTLSTLWQSSPLRAGRQFATVGRTHMANSVKLALRSSARLGSSQLGGSLRQLGSDSFSTMSPVLPKQLRQLSEPTGKIIWVKTNTVRPCVWLVYEPASVRSRPDEAGPAQCWLDGGAELFPFRAHHMPASGSARPTPHSPQGPACSTSAAGAASEIWWNLQISRPSLAPARSPPGQDGANCARPKDGRLCAGAHKSGSDDMQIAAR